MGTPPHDLPTTTPSLVRQNAVTPSRGSWGTREPEQEQQQEPQQEPHQEPQQESEQQRQQQPSGGN